MPRRLSRTILLTGAACQTYIGPILIAVNPYKPIPIFSPGYVDKYFNRAASDVSAPAPQHAASPGAAS